ncbi:MAG TPA: acyl-CoA dehydrogenase family protein [Acidimicrobiales bacterium]|jgi:alkylation response protein AidB-like acyl-CoA dehydrogenase|nr:acyl-CoA dehydrogenase family protein [Acidimicrobiales bacterium]
MTEPATPAHEELRVLLEEDILPRHRERWGDSAEWDAQVDFQRQLGRHGWTAPGWPIDIGGRGLDIQEQLACDVVFHELGAPNRVAVFGVNNVGPTIAAWGTPEQREHLAAMCAGTEVWCQGFSEPDAGSDLAGLRTTARVDGEHFVIDGQKIWTSIGLGATHCMLLVRTDPEATKHNGISALLVALDTPGITRRPIRQIDGGSEFAELFFDEASVPLSALLGPLHEGWRVTMTTLGYERAGVLSVSGRLASEAERMILDLAARGDLGGARRDRAMRVLIHSRLLRLIGGRALAAEADGPGVFSTLIKLAWSTLAQEMDELAVDTAGMAGIAGFHLEPARRLLNGRSLTIAGGTTEVLKNLVGERVLGLPKEPRPPAR